MVNRRIKNILINTLIVALCILLFGGCSKSKNDAYQTVLFTENVTTSEAATVDTTENSDIDQPQSLFYDEINKSYFGNYSDAICSIACEFRVIENNNENSIVNIYNCHRASEEMIRLEYFLQETGCSSGVPLIMTGAIDHTDRYELLFDNTYHSRQIRDINDIDVNTISIIEETIEGQYPIDVYNQVITYTTIPYSENIDNTIDIDSMLMGYYCIRSSISGIPVGSDLLSINHLASPIFYMNKQGCIDLCQLPHFFQTAQGIIEFDLTYLKDIEEYSQVEIMPFSDCYQTVIPSISGYCNERRLHLDVNVYAAELIYIPFFEYNSPPVEADDSIDGYLIPVWAVYWYGRDTQHDNQKYHRALFIDATNGDVL